MNIHLKITVITLLVRIIVERDGLSEQEAIAALYQSEIMKKLSEDNLLLLQMSPYLIYELWKTERETGDYKLSPYMDAFI
jgi:hypothetical protein